MRERDYEPPAITRLGGLVILFLARLPMILSKRATSRLQRERDALRRENAALREMESILREPPLAPACWEHSENCCRDWCEACRRGAEDQPKHEDRHQRLMAILAAVEAARAR